MLGETGIISQYQSGMDLVFEWKISDFFTHSVEDGAFYRSPEFICGSERWCLFIWPNGFSGRCSSGRVDLELCKYPFSRSIRQSFSLSLKTAKGEKYYEEHVTRYFDGRFHSHVFNGFIQRSELTMKSSELVPEGVLTVVCTIKSSPSAGNDKGETSNAEVNKSHEAEASGSSQACTTLSKESVLKWIEENCREALKGKKRKREEENTDGSLSQDFKKLLLEGLNHDLILKVGDKELRAHQDVLRARSQVFKSKLDHNMKEKNSGIIDIPDCDPLAMEQFLFYIYSGNIETLDQSNMFNLYYIADKYEMKGLKKIINDFIGESLSQTNICDVIQLALKHSDSSLLDSTTVYLRNNMLGIMGTVEWQKFLKDNSTVANELLMKALKS